MDLDTWFLTVEERGNTWTEIDRRRGGVVAWTEGNAVTPLADGTAYFGRLYDALCRLRDDDWVHLTDWEGDPDQRLTDRPETLADVLCDLARRDVHVRGLVWRSHPRQAHFSEQEHVRLVREVNDAGGEILLDERVRRGGSHHQKLVLLRHAAGAADDVAFVGGIDLAHGRRDDHRHLGDPQPVELDARYGERPPWHDVQLEVRGPAVGDLAHTFRERWDDPTPLDHRNPWRAGVRALTRQPRHPDPLPPVRADPPAQGTHAVQVLRTYPAKRPAYPFAPEGERSIARAYRKAIARARRLIYLEDQYLWSRHAADTLASALRREPELRLLMVVPRFAEHGGRSADAENVGRHEVLSILRAAGGDRVGVYDLENTDGVPIYVHAKVCIIDDVWLEIGSDNLNRRSWTHDSELSCAVIDAELDGRPPVDPGGLGDGARRLARDTRLALWREHLGRAPDDVDDLVDPERGFEAWRATAAALAGWHATGRRGARPPGHVLVHEPEPVSGAARLWARVAHRSFVDPDGRPRRLRRRDLL